MENADLFKYILANKTIPEETISDYEFRFKTVFYRCAFDHEHFSYISDGGHVDLANCDTLANTLKDGHCQHAAGVAKLLKQCYRYHKLRKAFSKFYRSHFELIEQYHGSLKKTYATRCL